MSTVETVPEMLARATETDAPLEVLVDVAERYVAKWADLASQVESGAQLDGRASIYTGETYTEARDRWAAYRDALLVEDDAPCCYGNVTSGGRDHEPGCAA